MSEASDRRVRQLLHHTASVIGEEDARDLLAGIGSITTAPLRPKQGGHLRPRPLAVAAVMIAVLAVTVGIVQSLRPPPRGQAATTASTGAPAPLTCPFHLPAAKVPPPAQQADMVTAAPTEGLLCAYGALPDQKPTGSKKIPTDRLAELRTRLNALPPPLAAGCPMDDGSAYLIALRSPAGDQNIVIKRTGCGEVSDGHQVRRYTAELMILVAVLV